MNSEHAERPAQGEDPRVRLAGERTLLAWVRTGMAMMGFGFVVARFGLFLRELASAGQRTPPHSTGVSLWVGTALVLLGVAVTTLAAVEHYRFLHRLQRGEPYRPPRWPVSIFLAGALATLGAALAVYLIVVGH